MSSPDPEDSVPEVNSARSRLSGALSTAERIVDKYAGEDFPLSPFKRFQSLDSPFPSPSKSPRSVRRRRKKPMPLNTAFHHTFVMKLFDRSVDLAQFPDHTTLYPVCRAWMKNEPHNTNMAPRLRTPTPEPGEDKKDDNNEDENHDEEDDATMQDMTNEDVYKLPPPEPLQVSEEGKEMSIRIPQVQMPLIPKNFMAKPDPEPADTSDLLSNHMQRWQNVRRCWRQAAQENEKRFSASMNILTEMYEKQQ